MDKKYQTVRDYLMDIIKTSPPNTKLPSERDLMEQTGFSRPTVQKALSSLESDGFCYRVDRVGAFSSMPDDNLFNMNKLDSFFEIIKETNGNFKVEVNDFQVIIANEFLATKLKLENDFVIHYILYILKKNNTPIAISYSYFANFALYKITANDYSQSLYEYVENVGGLSISHSDTTLEVEIPDIEVTQLLKSDPKQPVLKLEKTSTLKDGRNFEYTITYINSSFHKPTFKSMR